MKILRIWFDNKLFLHFINEKENILPPRHQLGGGVCVHGHFNRERGVGIQTYYPEVDQFIAVLRDPFDVAASLYFYLKNSESYSLGGKEQGKPGSRNLRAYIENFMRSARPPMLMHMPEEITISNYKEVLERKFVYIGITENLQGSVDTLAMKLGFPSVDVGIVNASKRDEDAPDDLRAAFRDQFPLEYAIYDYAVAAQKHP